MACTDAVDLVASLHDDHANSAQYALLSAVWSASADAQNEAAASTTGDAGAPAAPESGHGDDAVTAEAPGPAVVASPGDGTAAVATGAVNAASVFGCLVELVRFLRSHVFCGNDEVLGVFMEVFWPQCSEHAAQAAGTVTDNAEALQQTIEVTPPLLESSLRATCVNGATP